jgi:hypothetical protein
MPLRAVGIGARRSQRSVAIVGRIRRRTEDQKDVGLKPRKLLPSVIGRDGVGACPSCANNELSRRPSWQVELRDGGNAVAAVRLY